MTDIVVGAITNYSWDHIKFWINSLNTCGFKGRKVLVCHNIDTNTLNKINGHGVEVCLVEHNPDNICVDRFFWYWQLINFLNLNSNDLIVATDVRDVVFQSDPIKWIREQVYTPKILASSEGVKYQDEVWGRENFRLSFQEETWPLVQNQVILNAGVIAGKISYIKDLFLNIYWTSRGARYQHVPGGGGPDQAAYNMLMSLKPYYEVTRVASIDSTWAAQLGTTGPQVKYGELGQLTNSPPKIDGNIVVNHAEKPYAIVHQYDRIPEWRQVIEKRFG